MLKDLFKKKKKYVTLKIDKQQKTAPQREIPADSSAPSKTVSPHDRAEALWIKCPVCGEVIYQKELENNLKVCQKCDYHFRLSSIERLAITIDDNSFIEHDEDLTSLNPLDFPDYSLLACSSGRSPRIDE